MCDVALTCSGFDTLFGPCVFAAVFSPNRLSSDIVNHYGITDYVMQSESQRYSKYKTIKKLNRVALGYFVKLITPEDLSNELLVGDLGDHISAKQIW